MSAETCPADVYTQGAWTPHICGKPVKRRGLCGIHAGAQERIEKNDRARVEGKARSQLIVDRLAKHGVYAFATADGTARISMSAEALADLLDGEVSQ